MADVEEIRAYVETHPDDHKQRWRLAKKLYTAWDYRSALEQLLLLRDVWPDQLSVLRYLAATYYRLGRYEEAEEELKRGLIDHPSERTLLEQLAKVYEGSGRTERAIETWSRILEAGSSKTAEEALERLGMAVGTMASSTMAATATGEISSHGGETVVVCPHCGEGNDVFSKRCARCHGDFGAHSENEDSPVEASIPPRGFAGLIFALSFVLIVVIAVLTFSWLT